MVAAAKHDRLLEVAWRVSDRNMVLVAALIVEDSSGKSSCKMTIVEID